MKVEINFLTNPQNKISFVNNKSKDVFKIFNNVHNCYVNGKKIDKVAISFSKEFFIPFNEDMDPLELFLNNAIDYNINDYMIIPTKGYLTLETDQYIDKTLRILSKWSLNGGRQLEIRNDTYLNDKGINKPIRESSDNFIKNYGVINYKKYEISNLGIQFLNAIKNLKDEFVYLDEDKSWEFKILEKTDDLLKIIKTYPSIQEIILNNDKSENMFKELYKGVYRNDISIIKRVIFDENDSFIYILNEQLTKCNNKKNSLNHNIKGVFNNVSMAKDEISNIIDEINNKSSIYSDLRKLLDMKEDDFYKSETQSFSWPK